MITQLLHALGAALWDAFAMFWKIFWGLSLGFALSAIIEVLVPKDAMARVLPNRRPRAIATAGLLGAATSSCSYAAVAMARSIVRKGGDFTAAMAFQFAATNLVLELGVLLWAMMAWQFAAAEFAGGVLMLVLLAAGFALLLPGRLEREAIENARGDAVGAMEGHAAMAMGRRSGSWRRRLTSRAGWVEISHYYVMNWAMVWKDIAAGVLIAGALAAWVPHAVWSALFLQGTGPWSTALWGAVIGPLIAMAAFTCSIGNVPLAAVLWSGGIGFAGVIAFLFGDLIILPILNIYRKYYGARAAAFLLATFYPLMVLAALGVEGLFHLAGWLPQHRDVVVTMAGVGLDYTGVLNIALAVLAAILTVIYLRTGGPAMMRMMNAGGHDGHAHGHDHGDDHDHGQGHDAHSGHG